MVQRPTSIVETKRSLDKSFDRNEDFECLFRRDIEFRHETINTRLASRENLVSRRWVVTEFWSAEEG